MDWITPSGEDLRMDIIDKSKGEGKIEGEDGPIIEATISIAALMVIGTVCALVLHWAGVI